MYLALFVTPRLAMYAMSTLIFNHAAEVDQIYERLYGPRFDKYVVEQQLTYDKAFPTNSTLRTKAVEILTDLNLNGSFGVERTDEGFVITRRDPFIPRRITYVAGSHTLTVERQNSALATFLTTLHTQVSYTNKLRRIKVWAASVDLTIAAMILLVLSGVWMWWELQATRFLGSLFISLGVLLFCAFVFLT